jgi:hypothetical protein
MEETALPKDHVEAPSSAPVGVIYTITAIALGPDHDSRTWGWFPTFKEALECLRADNNDLIFESATFTHAIIEAVPSGFMGRAFMMDGEEVWWFQAHPHSDGKYWVEQMDEPPPEWKGVVGFSMG